jgi:MoaA/NifB/PqqE/SkfB family radical SAM enzyme
MQASRTQVVFMTTAGVVRIAGNFIAARYLHRRRLIHLELELTRKCNFRCSYCNLQHENSRELDEQDIIRLLDKYQRDIAFVFLTGGEPLLYSHFDDLVDNIRRRGGIYLYVTTNGSLFSRNIGVLKKVNLVSFSLDGPRETHEAHRPAGSFEKIMEAMRLAELNGIKVGVTCVLTKENVARIDEVLSFFEALNLFVTFAPMNHSTNLTDDDYARLRPAGGNLSLALERIIDLKKRTRIVLNSFASLRRLKDPGRFKDCYWGRISAYVNADGFFQPCCLLKDRDQKWNIGDEVVSRKYLMKADWSGCEYCEQQVNLSLHEVMSFIIRERRSLVPKRMGPVFS